MRIRDQRTADLFEVPQPAPEAPGSQDYRAEIANLVSSLLKKAPCEDRFEVAARMSRLLGREISKYMLDAWSSEAREAHNIPLYVIPVMEAVCQANDFAVWHAAKVGARVLVGRDVLTAELGKLERVRDEAAQGIRALKQLMQHGANK